MAPVEYHQCKVMAEKHGEISDEFGEIVRARELKRGEKVRRGDIRRRYNRPGEYIKCSSSIGLTVGVELAPGTFARPDFLE